MKKALLLLLLPVLVLAQSTEKTITPYVSTSTIDSVTASAGSTTLTTPSAWAGVDTDQVIFGPGIAEGTTVTGVNATSDTITISTATLDTLPLATLNFSLFSGTAYGSGDWLGFPFQIWNNTSGGIMSLESILIADSSDQLGNTDIILFSAYASDNGLDNATVAVPEPEYKTLLASLSLTTAVDLGTVRILSANAQGIAIPRGGKLYGRLIAKSTPTFTSNQALYVRLRFIQ